MDLPTWIQAIAAVISATTAVFTAWLAWRYRERHRSTDGDKQLRAETDSSV